MYIVHVKFSKYGSVDVISNVPNTGHSPQESGLFIACYLLEILYVTSLLQLYILSVMSLIVVGHPMCDVTLGN